MQESERHHMIISQLKPQYFWDVDISKLDDRKSKRLIIERVFSLGSLHDIQVIMEHYGEKDVTDVLCKLNYIDPKTFNFIIKFFNLPKSAFACHNRKLSNLQHLNL